MVYSYGKVIYIRAAGFLYSDYTWVHPKAECTELFPAPIPTSGDGRSPLDDTYTASDTVLTYYKQRSVPGCFYGRPFATGTFIIWAVDYSYSLVFKRDTKALGVGYTHPHSVLVHLRHYITFPAHHRGLGGIHWLHGLPSHLVTDRGFYIHTLTGWFTVTCRYHGHFNYVIYYRGHETFFH